MKTYETLHEAYQKKGFTLVEILVVIGIIAIAVMLFVPEGIIGLPYRLKSWFGKPKGQAKEGQSSA